MKTIELKHLAPYLPYNLKFRQRVRKPTSPVAYYYKNRLMTVGNIEWLLTSEIQKPVLRPLSDLTNDEYHLKIKSWFINHAENDVQITTYDNGNYIGLTATYKMMGDVFTDIIINAGGINDTDYWLVENLLKNHFDVFGLIEKGLAIDINTI